MSGGSYDYAYRRVEDVAGEVRARHATDPLVLAFADHLTAVAEAMRAVEWWDSGDTSRDDAEPPIRRLLDANALNVATTELLTRVARDTLAALSPRTPEAP